jgi:hypothetical protein
MVNLVNILSVVLNVSMILSIRSFFLKGSKAGR